MEFFDADGTVLHIAGAGQGLPLVMVNSLGSDLRIWDAVLPDLTGRARVVRYDKRGHGLSDLGPISMAAHVADLAALLDGLETGPAVICGLSVGGQIALGLSAARPDLVRGLILIGTAHRIGTPESWEERIATVKEGGIAAIADGVLEKWFTPDFHAARPADLAGARNMLTRTPLAGYADTCAAIRDADFTRAAQAVAVPTLCAVGDRDGSTPPDLVRDLAALIPGADFQMIVDAAHVPCIEQPAATAGLIAGFLDGLAGRP